MTRYEEEELLKCSRSPLYFAHTFCHIYDTTSEDGTGTGGKWIQFELWRAQAQTLKTIHMRQLTCILKARQLGLSWLVLSYALWQMIFRPAATILIFSKREDEAIYLLGDERLKGMYTRLPDFMKAGREVVTDDKRVWSLSNGSIARAFSTKAGDGYTATLAIVDEADLAVDLGQLLKAVKPTVDAGGKLILLSRVDKKRPNTEFKRIYRAARRKLNKWAAVFLPWHVRPTRTERWYEEQKQEALSRTGALDYVHEQYPTTDDEALAPLSLDKRIPGEWLRRNYTPELPLSDDAVADLLAALPRASRPDKPPCIPGLELYRLPEKGRKYVLGVDTAEGNPNSDDSTITVADRLTGEEVASLAGKVEPAVLGSYVEILARYYGKAPVLVERNNHGHAVLLWLSDNAKGISLMKGMDNKAGWLDNSKGKTLLYNAVTEAFRDNSVTVHSEGTYAQLASIESSTLRAPSGDHDDRADSFALAILATTLPENTLNIRRL